MNQQTFSREKINYRLCFTLKTYMFTLKKALKHRFKTAVFRTILQSSGNIAAMTAKKCYLVVYFYHDIKTM